MSHVYWRSPALQARIDEYDALREAEVIRILGDVSIVTLEQSVAALRQWDRENDFVRFVSRRFK